METKKEVETITNGIGITSEDLKKEYDKGLQACMVTDNLVNQALKYLETTNPLNVLKAVIERKGGKIEGDAEILRSGAQRIQQLMETWITSYGSVLDAGKSLPIDLIGRASDIAKKMRS